MAFKEGGVIPHKCLVIVRSLVSWHCSYGILLGIAWNH
jgi:hypothetical protein